jgi:hypothetical protein
MGIISSQNSQGSITSPSSVLLRPLEVTADVDLEPTRPPLLLLVVASLGVSPLSILLTMELLLWDLPSAELPDPMTELLEDLSKVAED